MNYLADITIKPRDDDYIITITFGGLKLRGHLSAQRLITLIRRGHTVAERCSIECISIDEVSLGARVKEVMTGD